MTTNNEKMKIGKMKGGRRQLKKEKGIHQNKTWQSNAPSL
jgi:hypothetical protein